MRLILFLGLIIFLSSCNMDNSAKKSYIISQTKQEDSSSEEE